MAFEAVGLKLGQELGDGAGGEGRAGDSTRALLRRLGFMLEVVGTLN